MGIEEIDGNLCAIDNEQKESKQTKGLCNAIIFHKFQKMKWKFYITNKFHLTNSDINGLIGVTFVGNNLVCVYLIGTSFTYIDMGIFMHQPFTI